MSAFIKGMGWITPLGSGLDEVWEKIEAGEKAVPQEISSSHSIKKHLACTVPSKTVEALGRNPRLRRSSVITYYSVASALAALDHAGIVMTPEIAARTAVVFAVCSGGVVYTRKFYEAVVQQGANAASPLLFPETVYNAPASHLAALLGVTGMSYTLVGDGSIGLAALKFGEQLLATSAIDYCIVAGGEEIDWVLCEAYRKSRIAATLAEGGAAVVLARDGRVALDPIHDGRAFFNQKQARIAIAEVMRDLAEQTGNIKLAIGCGNGTFIDTAESAALTEFFPDVDVIHPKQALGEALGAGALMQVIHGALAMAKRGFPKVVVSSLGFNQQAGGLVLKAN